MQTKQCSHCRQSKPVESFPVSDWKADGSARKGDGRRSQCYQCRDRRRKEIVAGWPEDRRQQASRKQQKFSRAWDRAHPHNVRSRQANQQARRRGASGRVSEDEVRLAWDRTSGLCWICGRTASEVDHFRPINKAAGGENTASNIRPVCHFCNHKRDHQWRGERYAMKEAAILKTLRDLADEHSRVTVHADVGLPNGGDR